MCVGLFFESNDWCRGFIDGVNLDSFVYVYYFDYGNSELLFCLKVCFFELCFQYLCLMVLRCLFIGVFFVYLNSWFYNVKEVFLF